MKVTVPTEMAPTIRDLHRRKCFLLGITEAWKEEALWCEEAARRKARAEAQAAAQAAERQARREAANGALN